MAHYAAWVLARSPERLLVEVPEMKTLFGSRWSELQDRGDGWQLAVVSPQYHEWPHVGGGPQDLVAATGAPVLAAWVSESSCARLVAATPAGRSWSRHLLSRSGLAKGQCGYDHERFATLRIAAGEKVGAGDTRTPLNNLLAWAREAGFTASPGKVAEVLHSHEFNGHDRMAALVDAIGVPFVDQIPMLFEHQELAWSKTSNQGVRASLRVCSRWTSAAEGDEGEQALAWDADHLEFLDLVSAAVFGAGLSYDDLVALSKRLDERWSAEINASRHRRQA